MDKIIQNDMEEIIANEYIPFEKLRNKNVLVTGANGMLAYYFTCVLMHLNNKKNMNIKVVALVRNLAKAEKKFDIFLNNPLFELLPQDVCNQIIIKDDIHYILHAAGAASPKFIESDPVGIIAANTRGTCNVMELARKNPIENILFTSTREVYGKVDGISWIKEYDMGVFDPLDSRSCYPESKRMAEQICKSYYNQYKVPFTVARIAHSYGPGMDIDQDGRVMSDFISDVVNNRNIVLKSAGTAVRAFCYITDVIKAMFLVMLEGEIGEAYNIANETEPVEIKDVAKMLVDLFPEKKLKVIFETSDNNNGYCQYERVGLSTEKIGSLGWSPSCNLENGLEKTVNSFL